MRCRRAILVPAIVWTAATGRTPDVAAQKPPTIAVSSAVSPDSVTVGDPFTSMARVSAPPGARIEFHGLPVGDTLQPLDTVRVTGVTDAGVTATYRLVAWVAGAPLSAEPTVRITFPDGSTAGYRIPLAVPVVRSVHPAGARDLTPRPSRGVIPLRGPGRWLLPAVSVAVLIAIVLGALAWRRGRRGKAPLVRVDPRDAALQALDELEAETRPAPTFDAGARIIRRYLGELHPGWGEEWTTGELIPRVRGGAVDPTWTSELGEILSVADRVKFAGRVPTLTEAARFRVRLREWISSYPPAAAASDEAA